MIYQTYASTNGMIGVTFESKTKVSHSTERCSDECWALRKVQETNWLSGY